MVQKELKNKTKHYALAAILSAIIIVSVIYTVTTPTVMYSLIGISPMKNFTSNDELKNYLLTNSATIFLTTTTGSYTMGQSRFPVRGGDSVADSFSAAPKPSAYSAKGSTSIATSSQDYSTTNVQVVGVDEADTVKTDGKYVYVLTGQYTDNPSIQIIQADSKKPSIVSKIEFSNPAPYIAGIYLSEDGNKLAVLGNNYNDITSVVESFIYVYNVSNRAEPILTRTMTLSGNYFNSRMIGNYVYAIVSQPAYVDDETVILPQISIDTATQDIEPSCIYYTDRQDNYFSYNTFAGLNIMDDFEQPTSMTILMGVSSCMYVSTSNMYVTFPNADGNTEIYRVAVDGASLTFEAQGFVLGYVLNQYSMDEYNNYFRIATTVSTGSWINRDEHNNLYVLNMNLKTVGKIENIAPDERVYSARFTGDKAYIVTFKQTDPFFVLDLKNPVSPKVVGELKIPGYSSYLHPYNENYVIGIGKEGNDVKLSLFDVTDMENPAEIAKYITNEKLYGSYSIALDDPKAFLFDQQKQLLVLPISGNIPDYNYWSGAYVFHVSPENGFTLQKEIDHALPLQTPDDNSKYLRYEAITRSLYIGNILYTISNSQVQLTNLDDFRLITQIIL